MDKDRMNNFHRDWCDRNNCDYRSAVMADLPAGGGIPVARIIRMPAVMVVHPSVPAKTVPEFMGHTKANPSKLNFASPGNGSAPHLAGELFKAMTGINMVHVPYRPFHDRDAPGQMLHTSGLRLCVASKLGRYGKGPPVRGHWVARLIPSRCSVEPVANQSQF
jgi:Tripartite tricarboxylate transporter family receptor